MANTTTPASLPDPYQGIRVSFARFLVTCGSLAAGQVLLVENDARKVVSRALLGGTITELTAAALRFSQERAERAVQIDPTWLASYGTVELRRIYLDMLRQRVDVMREMGR